MITKELGQADIEWKLLDTSKNVLIQVFTRGLIFLADDL